MASVVRREPADQQAAKAAVPVFRRARRIPPALHRHGTFLGCGFMTEPSRRSIFATRNWASCSAANFGNCSLARCPVTFVANWLLCAASVRLALVAQLDRASDFESEGREFESLRARHLRSVGPLTVRGGGIPDAIRPFACRVAVVGQDFVQRSDTE